MAKGKDTVEKVIWTAGIMLVLIAFNIFMLSNLGSAPVDAHRQEFFGQLFTGSAFDWVGFVLFNASSIFIGIGIWGGWQKSENEQSTAWGIAWVVSLVICMIMIGVG